MSANPLEKWFEKTQGRGVHKWMHYFDIYHRHFRRFRGRRITIVEFGVHVGGSAQMWREYFGSRVKIYGIDIDPRCKNWETPWFKIFVGDQADRKFLRRVANKVGPIDILIEDGGHRPDQQIATFEEFYPLVKPDGVFLIEDLLTSYAPHYNGGLRQSGTFIEYAKPLIDQLNAYHSWQDDFGPDEFTRSTRSMHIYDSVIVFEKGRVAKPYNKRRGHLTWEKGAYPLELSLGSRLRSTAVAVKEKATSASRRLTGRRGAPRVPESARQSAVLAERSASARTAKG